MHNNLALREFLASLAHELEEMLLMRKHAFVLKETEEMERRIVVLPVRDESLPLRALEEFAGRKTIGDFPGQKPLPGRVNVVLSRSGNEIPGFTLCGSVEEAVELAKTADRAMVIGGGSIYQQMLPYCDTAYITKVHCTIDSDTFFSDLDKDPNWALEEVLQQGEENGIAYEMCLYKRKGTA